MQHCGSFRPSLGIEVGNNPNGQRLHTSYRNHLSSIKCLRERFTPNGVVNRQPASRPEPIVVQRALGHQ